jgi:hypothetical protein
MPTVGGIGHTTTISYGAVPVSVAQVQDVNLGAVTVDSVEVTNNDSSDSTKEFVPGLIDSGEITFTCLFDPGEVETHLTELQSLATTTWTVTLPTGALGGSTWAGSGFITSMSAPVPMGDAVTVDFTVKITGGVTFTDNTA